MTDKLSYSGFFKIWKVHKKTGKSELVCSKKNMILYQGADLLAKALAGVKNAKVSHMYIGYKTVADISGFVPPTIDKEYSNPFTDYDVAVGLEDLGYLRLPLSFTPTYLSSDDYDNNTVIFTSVVSNNTTAFSGADFEDSGEAAPSHMFEVALVAALDPTGASQDKIFSRANFDPIVYDSNYNLTISWGIQFLA
jgi:hypothetical protein